MLEYWWTTLYSWVRADPFLGSLPVSPYTEYYPIAETTIASLSLPTMTESFATVATCDFCNGDLLCSFFCFPGEEDGSGRDVCLRCYPGVEQKELYSPSWLFNPSDLLIARSTIVDLANRRGEGAIWPNARIDGLDLIKSVLISSLFLSLLFAQ